MPTTPLSVFEQWGCSHSTSDKSQKISVAMTQHVSGKGQVVSSPAASEAGANADSPARAPVSDSAVDARSPQASTASPGAPSKASSDGAPATSNGNQSPLIQCAPQTWPKLGGVQFQLILLAQLMGCQQSANRMSCLRRLLLQILHDLAHRLPIIDSRALVLMHRGLAFVSLAPQSVSCPQLGSVL